MAKILVVDDSPFYRNLVTELLANRGHIVIQTGQISRARVLMLENYFDIIITDLDVDYPESGINLGLLKRVPTHIIIASTDATALAKIDTKGGCSLLLKPFNPNLLLQIIRRYKDNPNNASTLNAVSTSA